MERKKRIRQNHFTFLNIQVILFLQWEQVDEARIPDQPISMV